MRTVVEAQSYAETLCIEVMAKSYFENFDEEYYDWYRVDCFDLEGFIKQHAQF